MADELLKREKYILGDTWLLANLLDHSFRGKLLSPSERRKAVGLLLNLLPPEQSEAVLDELENVEKRAWRFSSEFVHKELLRSTFWKWVSQTPSWHRMARRIAPSLRALLQWSECGAQQRFKPKDWKD